MNRGTWLRLTGSFRALTLLAVIVLLGAVVPRAAAELEKPRVLVLVSNESAPYQQSVEGLTKRLDALGIGGGADIVRLNVESEGVDDILSSHIENKPNVIVAVGSLALQARLRNNFDAPTVATMILDDDEVKKAPRTAGICLRFPIETELQWVRKLLPDSKNIAVMYDPKENGALVERAKTVATRFGFQLQAHPVEAPRDLPGEMEDIARNADVLWGIPDQVVTTPQTARPILLFSFRNRIPLVGLSASWVKAGALFALERDYEDIGAQTAEVVASILSGTDPKSIAIAAPRKVVYQINLKTARQMKLSLPGEMIKGAAEVIE